MSGKFWVMIGLLFCTFLLGCKDPYAAEKAAAKKKEEEEKRELTETGILGKKTNKVFEFDPLKDAGKISDGKMKETSALNPLGAMNALKPASEQLVKLKFVTLLNMFQATHGRFPKSFKEFQDQVVEPNKQQLPLPVLPGDWVYKYDVKNHKIVVVEDKEAKKEELKDVF